MKNTILFVSFLSLSTIYHSTILGVPHNTDSKRTGFSLDLTSRLIKLLEEQNIEVRDFMDWATGMRQRISRPVVQPAQTTFSPDSARELVALLASRGIDKTMFLNWIEEQRFSLNEDELARPKAYLGKIEREAQEALEKLGACPNKAYYLVTNYEPMWASDKHKSKIQEILNDIEKGLKEHPIYCLIMIQRLANSQEWQQAHELGLEMINFYKTNIQGY